MNLDLFCKDIINIYEKLIEENVVRKLGIVNHDIFQEELFKLGGKYGLSAQKEYRGRSFVDIDTNKKKRGRIDLVYYKGSMPYISLEIDSGLKKSSIKKLLANNKFQHRIWFCYKKDIDINKYNSIIDTYDTNRELIYLLPNIK